MADIALKSRGVVDRVKYEFQWSGVIRLQARLADQELADRACRVLAPLVDHVESQGNRIIAISEVDRGTLRATGLARVRGWVRFLERHGFDLTAIEASTESPPASTRMWWSLKRERKPGPRPTPRQWIGRVMSPGPRPSASLFPTRLMTPAEAEVATVPSGWVYTKENVWSLLPADGRAYAAATLCAYFGGILQLPGDTLFVLAAGVLAVLGWVLPTQHDQSRGWRRGVGMLTVLSAFGVGTLIARSALGPTSWRGLGVAVLAAMVYVAAVLSLTLIVKAFAGGRWLVAAQALAVLVGLAGIQQVGQTLLTRQFLAGMGAPSFPLATAGGDIWATAPRSSLGLVVLGFITAVLLALLRQPFSAMTRLLVGPVLGAVFLAPAALSLWCGVWAAGAALRAGDLRTTGHIAARVCLVNAADLGWADAHLPYVVLTTGNGHLVVGPVSAQRERDQLPLIYTGQDLEMSPPTGATCPKLAG